MVQHVKRILDQVSTSLIIFDSACSIVLLANALLDGSTPSVSSDDTSGFIGQHTGPRGSELKTFHSDVAEWILTKRLNFVPWWEEIWKGHTSAYIDVGNTNLAANHYNVYIKTPILYLGNFYGCT